MSFFCSLSSIHFLLFALFYLPTQLPGQGVFAAPFQSKSPHNVNQFAIVGDSIVSAQQVRSPSLLPFPTPLKIKHRCSSAPQTRFTSLTRQKGIRHKLMAIRHGQRVRIYPAISHTLTSSFLFPTQSIPSVPTRDARWMS